MEAQATFDFRASQNDELSFRQGDILKVLKNQPEEQWYRAEFNGAIGFVPKNRLRLTPVEWYHGVVTRNEAEQRLSSGQFPEGAFLVRDSESTPGDFSLSVKIRSQTGEPRVDHYRVLRDNSSYFLWEVRFNSLNELVNYHMEHSISRTNHITLVNIDLRPGGGGGGGPAQYNPQQQHSRPETFQARTAFQFMGEEANELSFNAGETITVHVYLQQRFNLNSNWWFGEINRHGNVQSGLFPSTYVVVTQQIRQQYQIQAETGM